MRSSITFLVVNTIASYNTIVSGFTFPLHSIKLRNENIFHQKVITNIQQEYQIVAPSYDEHHVSYKNMHNTKLYIIRGTSDEEIIDFTKGGVGLAIESAIKIVGDVKYSKSQKGKDGEPSVKITPTELLRYRKVTQIPESELELFINSNHVVCIGDGTELYKEPTEENPYEKETYFAPVEAAKDALGKIASAALLNTSNNQLIVNILSGDQLMLNEALDAVFMVVSKLLVDAEQGDTSHIKNISFNSLSGPSFPLDRATVSVVAVGSEETNADGDASIASSVQNGEVYFHQDKWWTVLKEDFNPDRN